MMDSRSIDFAKTASVDMMTLNNKIVNMRQVVKRTKVHIINKLCKHITALKKKKGTEEQKAKNLRKAERLIEEIDSIKKLKEDKVSKYALANTTSFNEITKVSLSPAPRALARLADHALMKKVVTDFREQHSDWQDLAAYLLIKQTGRRFKTKKQKQTKLSKSVENISASEIMTKAYIKERFGKEGLSKAEQRFERKRKRQSVASKPEAQGSDMEKNNEGKKQKIEKEGIPVGEDIEKELENVSSQKTVSETKNTKMHLVEQDTQADRGKACTEQTVTNSVENDSDSISVNSDDSVDSDRNSKKLSLDIDNSLKDNTGTSDEENGVGPISEWDQEKSHSESGATSESLAISNRHKNQIIMNKGKQVGKDSAPDSDSDNGSEQESSPDSENSESGSSSNEIIEDSKTEIAKKQQKDAKTKNECVVKALNIGEQDSDSSSDSESSSDNESDSESENDDVGNNESEKEDSFDNSENRQDSKKLSKKGKKKKKLVPEFLMKSNKKPISDPFFAGSDDDDNNETGGFNDKEQVGDFDSFGENASDDDFSYRKSEVGSMFHNPSPAEIREEDSRKHYGQRGGNRGSFSRRGDQRNYGKPHRGRGGPREFVNSNRGPGSFRGNMRGSGRGRGQNFRDRRGGSFQDRPIKHSKWSKGDSERSQDHDQAAFQRKHRPRDATDATGTHTGAHSADSTQQKGSKEKLHPSWEASKKRKAQQSGITAFSGSKITFDDD